MRANQARLRRLPLRDRRGVGAVEFALVLPLFLASMIGVIEVGRALWTQNTLQRAVEAAARCATVDATACGTTSAIQNFAVTQAFGLSVTSSVFTATSSACGNQVAANYAFTPFTTLVDLPSMTLTAQACFPK
jgi:Flp pilus assembly protein TadG